MAGSVSLKRSLTIARSRWRSSSAAAEISLPAQTAAKISSQARRAGNSSDAAVASGVLPLREMTHVADTVTDKEAGGSSDVREA